MQINHKLQFGSYHFTNRQTLVGRCAFGGLILALSVGLSLLLEFHHGLFGVGFRFVDCCLIVVMLPVLGLTVGLCTAFAAPLLHVACDGDHPPIETLQQIVMNVITVLIVYFGYFAVKNRQSRLNRIRGDKSQIWGSNWLQAMWIFLLFLIIYFVQLFSFFAMITLIAFNPSLAEYGVAKTLYRSWIVWGTVAGFYSLKYLITIAVFCYITPRLSTMLSQ